MVLAVVYSPPRRSCFLALRPRWTWSTPITGLGSGDHHATRYGSSPHPPAPPASLPTSSVPTRPIVPSATWSSYRNSLMVRKWSSGAGNGMIPRRYAPSTLAGLRSAPNATGLSLADAAVSNESQSGNCLAGITGPARDLAPLHPAGRGGAPRGTWAPAALA